MPQAVTEWAYKASKFIYFGNLCKGCICYFKSMFMKILYIPLVISILSVSSCGFMGKRVVGNGHMKTEEKTVSSFKNVDAGGNFKLIVVQGDLKPIKLEGDENILPYIEITQTGDQINIETKHGYNLYPSASLTVTVTSPVYSSIDVSGSSDIIGQNKITSTEELNLQASGAGDIKMEVDAPKITAGISGSGSITLKGQTKDADLSLSGAGHAYCFDLMSETVSVGISGAGSAEVYASVKLDASVSGAGNILYKGDPKVSQEISGAGSVGKSE